MQFDKKILSKQWTHGAYFLKFSIFLSFLLIAYYNLSKGFVLAPDTTDYSNWSDNLINFNLNLFDYYNQKNFAFQNALYTIPVVLFALSKVLFGAEWQYALLALNISLVLISLILFSKCLLLLKIRPFVISLSMPLLVLSVDLLVWPRYILTDTIFSFGIMLALYVIIRSIVEQKNFYLFITFILIFITLTRPTSLPFVLGVLFFILLIKLNFNFNPKIIAISLILLIILNPFLLLIFYQLMVTYLAESSQAEFLIKMVQQGMIIHDRPDTWVNVPKQQIDIVYIYFMRFLYFFTPYIKSFSNIHNILNFLQSFFILLSIFIWIFFGEKNYLINKTITFILLISMLCAAFHSFTLIDYDFRYRFPIIMPLIVIFPLSIEILLRKINYYKNN